MSEFYQFAGEHWFLTWSAMWLLWGVYALLEIAFRRLLFTLPNRLLRTIKVLFRGWPPEHLDADGDFKEDENVS